ncbi:cadmium resistance transporter [Brasilonema sp. UFV-L1]|uniref:cadmium resistance transporter n=1 Tax=Brasilonema sp. UFV-L1 TaxID=2234130 RepID=UPI00145E10E5|nr:cadmium resistance transporter [Brasilonema sp. UFV-L1]NMG05670.1 transporter [Brasilonema sp. UFV-L1]
MDNFLSAISTGFAAFTATNLDDIVVLLLFFSQVNATFRHQHIVVGQYLGFTALVLASLPSFFGGRLFPEAWIGLLGTAPIAIGINRLLNPQNDEDETAIEPEQSENSWLKNLFSPQAYGVAAVTIANGGDNLSIYVSLFASSTWEDLGIILLVFFLLVAVWCYTAYRFTQVPTLAKLLTSYGSYLVPFVLIGLGIFILIDSHTLENRGLTVLTAGLIGYCLMKEARDAFGYSIEGGSQSSQNISEVRVESKSQ